MYAVNGRYFAFFVTVHWYVTLTRELYVNCIRNMSSIDLTL